MSRIFIALISSLLSFSALSQNVNIERWQTQSGSHVLFVRATDLPMVDLSIAFRAGSAFDEKHWGLATLTASLINQGTLDLNATQIAEQFEDYGAIFSNDVDKDTTRFSLRSLSQKSSLKHALTTLENILSKPSFPPQSIKREKEQLLTTIHYMNEKPSSVASNAFYSTLYPNHPYGHSVLGTMQTIPQLKRSHVESFFKTHYTANNAVIAITGDLTLFEAKAISEKLSNVLNVETAVTNHALPIISRTQQAHTQAISFPSNQTNIIIGQVGIDHSNPHYFPLIVGNYTLGGSGLISRLANEVREKRGLTYGVYSSFQTFQTPGPFSISLATKTDKTKEALSVTLETLNKFLKEGPKQSELNAAKQYLIGSFPLRLSSNKSINNTLLNMGIYQLPVDYIDTYLDKINHVELNHINTAFRQTIDPNALTTITVGK